MDEDMTQNQQILHWLESHDSGLSTLEAFELFKCCRISERIRELERQGYLIEHEPERTSRGKRIMRYRLLKVAYG
jgi:hypothetical protein